jgi:hypothetical protein
LGWVSRVDTKTNNKQQKTNSKAIRTSQKKRKNKQKKTVSEPLYFGISLTITTFVLNGISGTRYTGYFI